MAQPDAVLHLYPSAPARDAALEALPAAAWSGSHLTFTEFVQRLDRQLPGGGQAAKRRLSDAGRQMLFAQALKELGEADRERLSGVDAALSAWVELYAAWKGAGLTPEGVRAAAKGLRQNPEVGETLDRLGRFFESYERLLGPDWLDREGYERQIQERLEKCRALPGRVLPAGAGVEAHAFHRLIPFQRRVLERLAALGHSVRLHAPAALTGQSFGGTFGALRDAVIWPKVRPPREYLRIEAATPYAEVYEIGRRVHGWIVQDRVPPARIGVTFRDLGPYSQAIGDVFKRFEIPYYERRGEPLVFQPLVRVALSAVDACVHGLGRRELFRFLCAGPVNVAGLARLPQAPAAGALHNLARKARVDRFFGQEAAQPAAAWRNRLRRLPADDQQGALLAIVDRLAAMCVTRSLRAHADAWRQLFSEAGLTPLALPRDEPRPANLQKDQMALAQLHQALSEVAEAPDRGAVPLDEFARCLTLAIQQRTLRAEGGETGGVRVLNLYDLRGLSFDRLVIGGMAEGVLPAPPAGNPLLSTRSAPAVRKALAAQLDDPSALLHVEPRLSDECRDEEWALFEIARACAADGRLVFTRPRADADGNPRGPSVFWNMFESGVETAAAIHPAPALAQCITPEERELRSAWVLGGGGENAEVLPAAGDYSRSTHLQEIARRAAVERARQLFFAQQPPPGGGEDEAGEGEGMLPQPPDETQTAWRPAGPYDGVVAAQAPEAQATLAKLLLAPAPPAEAQEPTVSPSDLEDLAGCRFRFLNDTLFKFAESVKPEAAISPRDCGTLCHDVLAEFYREQLKAALKVGRLVAQLNPSERKAYLKQLQAIAQTILTKAPERMFTGHPALFKLEEEKIGGALANWLDRELQRPQADSFYPAQVEFKFGPGGTARAVAVPFPGGGQALLLEGRMDRLDFKVANPDDTCPEVSAVRVIDYKLGRAKSYGDNVKVATLEALLAAQLPVYLKAALGYLAELEKSGKVRVDWPKVQAESQAGYYCLRELPVKEGKKDTSLVSIALGDLQHFFCEDPAAKGSLFATVRDKVTQVLQGDFAVQPAACTGTWCGSRFACRYQAVPPEGDDGRSKGDA